MNDDVKFTVDYGAVNLKHLIVTNDVAKYEQMKAQGNIGVIFEPKVVEDLSLSGKVDLYIIGLLLDKGEDHPSPTPS